MQTSLQWQKVQGSCSLLILRKQGGDGEREGKSVDQEEEGIACGQTSAS